MTEFERGRAAGLAEAMEVVEKPLVTLRFPGQKPRHLTLEVLRQPLSEDWSEQKRALGEAATPQDLRQIRGFTSEPRHVTVKEKGQA